MENHGTGGELDFHINRKIQPNETLEELNQSLFEGFGFTADQLAGNTVVEHLLNAPDLDFYFKKQ